MKKSVFLLVLVLILSIQGLFAQKVLNTYAGFTGTDIKNRADIPLQTNIVVNGSTVECRNITTTNIRTVINETVTGIGALCQSPNVNKWSNYGPREWLIVGGGIENSVKVPYQFGSFAGYDKEAVEPIPFSASFEYTKGATGSTITQSIAAKIKTGQYDWGKLGATHAKVIVYDSDNMIYSQSGILPINGAGNFLTFDNVSFTFPTGVVGVTEYVTKTYICTSDGSELAYLPQFGNVTCTIIAPTAYILTVKVSANVKTFTMIGEADHLTNGNVVTRSGTYSGTGTVNGKALNNIVYELLNKTTNAIESTSTVTTFNAYEYPLNLYDMMVNDAELFSVDQSRFTPPTATQYVRIIMNYL